MANPKKAINHGNKFNSLAFSMHGFNNEKKLAESIIPADKANIESKYVLFTFFKKNTNDEPRAVTKKVKVPPKKANNTGFCSKKNDNIKFTLL